VGAIIGRKKMPIGGKRRLAKSSGLCLRFDFGLRQKIDARSARKTKALQNL
jgi:hypothetical protein